MDLIWPHRLAWSRTPASQAENTGSNPVGATKTMKQDKGILIFGLIEIAIGAITLIALIASLILGKSTKPPQIFIFVLATSILSLGLGIGIIKGNLQSLRLLLYFASVIALSKILILAQVITLSGEIETTLPAPLKNIVSLVYHGLLIWYFIRKRIFLQLF